MKFVMHWEIPADKWQEAMFAYVAVTEGRQKGVTLDLYWETDLSDGKYRGIGIADVESEEALFEFFNVVGGVAHVRLTPALSGDPLKARWRKQLSSG
jgi:hypothetical protein